MKFFYKKRAFTLVEILVTITLLSIVMVGVFVFLTGAFSKLIYENSKPESFNELLKFRDDIEEFVDAGYKKFSLLSYENLNPNKALLLKNVDATLGSILVGVVHIQGEELSGRLQTEYVYGDNFLGYLRLTQSETETITSDFQTKVFFHDTIYPYIRVQNFQPTLYNTGSLVDIHLSFTHLEQEALKGRSFDKINDDELHLQNYNLVY